MKLPEEVKEQFRKAGSEGGKKQKRNVSKKKLSAWGKKGAKAKKQQKEANAAD